MTIQLSDLGQAYLVCEKTDRHQGIDPLAILPKASSIWIPYSIPFFATIR